MYWLMEWLGEYGPVMESVDSGVKVRSWDTAEEALEFMAFFPNLGLRLFRDENMIFDMPARPWDAPYSYYHQ